MVPSWRVIVPTANGDDYRLSTELFPNVRLQNTCPALRQMRPRWGVQMHYLAIAPASNLLYPGYLDHHSGHRPSPAPRWPIKRVRRTGPAKGGDAVRANGRPKHTGTISHYPREKTINHPDAWWPSNRCPNHSLKLKGNSRFRRCAMGGRQAGEAIGLFHTSNQLFSAAG